MIAVSWPLPNNLIFICSFCSGCTYIMITRVKGCVLAQLKLGSEISLRAAKVCNRDNPSYVFSFSLSNSGWFICLFVSANPWTKLNLFILKRAAKQTAQGLSPKHMDWRLYGFKTRLLNVQRCLLE